MLFERFRQSSPDRVPRFAFYGKLPFDREFLRYHLDSPDGRWITSWVDGAHKHIAAWRDTGEARTDTELRGVIARDDGRSALAVLIRPSTDGLRSYPSCAFCALPANEFRSRWHVTPLWLEPVWQSMAEHILETAATSRKDFDESLVQAPLEPAEPESVALRFENASLAGVGQPWRALTAASGEVARALAVTFVQLARVQREAAGGKGSIALRIALRAVEEPATLLQVAMWVRLFAAVSAFESAWPAVIQVQQRSEPLSRSVCIFGREPTPADLAFLLSGLGNSAIDDLRDAWVAEPEGDIDRQHIERLIDETARCFADLWQKMG